MDSGRERVRIIVRTAGGRIAMAEKSGLKLGTIDNLLAGQEMKRGQLVALADAAGVTVEWLATGRGPALLTDRDRNQEKASSSIDEKLLTTVIRAGNALLELRARKMDESQYARFIAALYSSGLESKIYAKSSGDSPEAVLKFASDAFASAERRLSAGVMRPDDPEKSGSPG